MRGAGGDVDEGSPGAAGSPGGEGEEAVLTPEWVNAVGKGTRAGRGAQGERRGASPTSGPTCACRYTGPSRLQRLLFVVSEHI